jgi:mono/diheme cytochrome c family protein
MCLADTTVVRAARVLALAVAVTALCGCEKQMRDMYDQPRYKPFAASPLWRDGAASRPPIAGTLPHAAGRIAGTSSGRHRETPMVASVPTPATSVPTTAIGVPTLATLRRGRERYDIYCAPCHSVVGDGDGMVVRRGFPAPPSFHTPRLREASDDYLRSVIRNGYGAMYAYATRVDAADAAAIVAYVRALQLSQAATFDDVPDDRRAALR